MDVVIIGGAGYIGSHISRALSHYDYQIHIVDKQSPPEHQDSDKKLNYYQFDVSQDHSEELLTRLLRTLDGDCVVIHLAAFKSVADSISHPEIYHANNFGSTKNVLSAMKECNLRKLVFSSTAAVYGTEEPVVKEDSPVNPISPYAQIKLQEEELIFSAEYADISSVIFRYFNVAGSDSTQHVDLGGDNIFPTISRAVHQNSIFYINGNSYNTPDGTCIRDYISISDLVNAHLCVLREFNWSTSEVFNLGSGRGFSVSQIVKSVSQRFDLRWDFGPERPGDIPIMVADVSKFRSRFDWDVTQSLDDIVTTSI